MTKYSNGYIVNPNHLWRPSYRISPFNTSFVKKNHSIFKNGKADEELIGSFFGPGYGFFESGRKAIFAALSHYRLQKNDEVWIVTTSGNRYISGCVTAEIEKFCSWSLERSEKTKLIFVNHEFGTCYKELKQLKEYGLPLIEDRALSFASKDKEGTTGTVGDFVVYSLPKFFPVSIGGVLQCNNTKVPGKKEESKELNSYLSILMSHYLQQLEAFSLKQRANYNYLSDRFVSLGFSPRFIYEEGEVPGVFMFNTSAINLPALKIFMNNNGVESSVFYGEEAFFIPIHHQLETGDLNFFCTLIDYFRINGDQ